MAPDPTPLLTAADRQALGRLLFVARRPVAGLYAGRHLSPRRGHSTEFHDYRQYLPGDEVKRVDWKLYGRTDRLYLRRFRHESDLNVGLLVDRSASMDFAGLGGGDGRQNKWTVARRLAAAIAFLLACQRDRWALLFFDTACRPAVEPGSGPAHLDRVLQALSAEQPGGRTDPVAAMTQAHQWLVRHLGRRVMVVVISDLLEPAGLWTGALGPMAHDRFDLIGLQVLHPQELDLRRAGPVHLVDRETGRSLRLVGQQVGPAYADRMRRHLHRLRTGLGRLGVDYQLIMTSMPIIGALGRFVWQRCDPMTAGR